MNTPERSPASHSGAAMRYSGLAYQGLRAARLLCRCLKRLVVAAIFIQLCIYAEDVHTRSTKKSTCDWRPVKDRFYEPNPRPPYVGRYCLVARGEVWLQLYDSSGQYLLAERMYHNADAAKFLWYTDPRGGPSYFMYESSSSDSGYGSISLPPTRMDRLLAALP
jgi:hypothetical protein